MPEPAKPPERIKPPIHGTPVPPEVFQRLRAAREKPELARAEMPAPEQLALEIPVVDKRVPSSARKFWAEAIQRGWQARITYARGPIEGQRARCPRCSELVLLKQDGELRTHGPRDNRCDGGSVTAAEILIVSSILVKCQNPELGLIVSAQWHDGRFDSAGYQSAERGAEMLGSLQQAMAYL